MGKTNIEWTSTVLPDGTVIPGYSSNPLRYRNAAGKDVWACVMTSPGCANCYAQASAVRFDKGHEFTRENMKSLVPYVREKEIKELVSPKKTPAGQKVFVCLTGDTSIPMADGRISHLDSIRPGEV